MAEVRAPLLATTGAACLTKDERRLLRALAAAQAADMALLDTYIHRFAIDRRARALLAGAIRALAAGLAASGCILHLDASRMCTLL